MVGITGPKAFLDFTQEQKMVRIQTGRGWEPQGLEQGSGARGADGPTGFLCLQAPQWKAQVASKAFLDGSGLPTPLGCCQDCFSGSGLKRPGASLALCLCLSVPGRAAWRTACCGFCCCNSVPGPRGMEKAACPKKKLLSLKQKKPTRLRMGG